MGSHPSTARDFRKLSRESLPLLSPRSLRGPTFSWHPRWTAPSSTSDRAQGRTFWEPRSRDGWRVRSLTWATEVEPAEPSAGTGSPRLFRWVADVTIHGDSMVRYALSLDARRADHEQQLQIHGHVGHGSESDAVHSRDESVTRT